ncbi:hypothetical protein Phou_053750 [Phytohabitans houttuyneae]|uniref:Uncharacterized protein n=1 Tax=Phytohabitans houttuyneae TaxID=1076126 RepID=A0A6V8KKH9_9ACTN|nr:hypothetical protein Phou_053750 [Phytohabitans houttuyneae]
MYSQVTPPGSEVAASGAALAVPDMATASGTAATIAANRIALRADDPVMVLPPGP